jgi:hypothetical protein
VVAQSTHLTTGTALSHRNERREERVNEGEGGVIWHLDMTTESWSSSLYKEKEAYSGTRLARPEAAIPRSLPLRAKERVPGGGGGRGG